MGVPSSKPSATLPIMLTCTSNSRLRYLSSFTARLLGFQSTISTSSSMQVTSMSTLCVPLSSPSKLSSAWNLAGVRLSQVERWARMTTFTRSMRSMILSLTISMFSGVLTTCTVRDSGYVSVQIGSSSLAATTQTMIAKTKASNKVLPCANNFRKIALLPTR
jgi:hypothetical protein